MACKPLRSQDLHDPARPSDSTHPPARSNASPRSPPSSRRVSARWPIFRPTSRCAKPHYWGSSRETQFLHWLIDREYGRCRRRRSDKERPRPHRGGGAGLEGFGRSGVHGPFRWRREPAPVGPPAADGPPCSRWANRRIGSAPAQHRRRRRRASLIDTYRSWSISSRSCSISPAAPMSSNLPS